MKARTDPKRDGAMKQIRLFALWILLISILTACAPAATGTPAATEPFATEAPTQAATEAPTVPPETTITPVVLSLNEQLARIDAAMKQTLDASIAYNRPESMKVDETVTIELLLNPSVSPQALSTQVSEPRQVASASVQITPRMKAVLVANDDTAFVIKSIHADPEQLIASTETTRWAWLVTAKKGGTQRLTLIIYRLVQYEGQDYWREVQSYKADIVVKVTIASWLESLDWKWVASAIIIPLLVAAWGWLRNKRKKTR